MNDTIDHIMEVMDQAFDPEFGEAWTRSQLIATMAMGQCHALVMDRHGRPTGFAGDAAGFALSRKVLNEEELLLIAVKPDYRRQGVGRKLLKQLLIDATERETDRLFLEMREGNPALDLYCEFGFTFIGRRPNYYSRGKGDPRDAITYERLLV